MEWLAAIHGFGEGLLGPTAWYVVWTLIKILCIALPVIILVAYLTYWERKMIAFMHVRRGDRKSTRLNSSHVAISYAIFSVIKKTSEVASPTSRTDSKRGETS